MKPTFSTRLRSSRRHPTDPRRLLMPLVILIGLAGAAPAAADGMGPAASAGSKIAYPMRSEAWTMAPPIGWVGPKGGAATFALDEGMPTGTMTLNEGVASLNSGSFSGGQIDFDIKPMGYDDAGIIFHRRGEEDGEFVYVRANPDCPAAVDCVQYAPITHRLMAWNIYPNYQGPAPISATGWNHVSIRVSGGAMLVFINYATEPSIVVPELRGLAPDGGIAFKGPAVYANLVVRPNETPDMTKVAAETVEAGTVTAWLAAAPSAHVRAHPVSANEIPGPAAWRPIDVEPSGLVNLGRAFGAGRAPSLSTAWLKTVVTASTQVRRTIHLGFAEQASVFLNGKLVYSGSNIYYPAKDRISIGGRIRMDNASIPLDLHRGRNEIVLAVGNDWRPDEPAPRTPHYGWAAEARFDQRDGLDGR